MNKREKTLRRDHARKNNKKKVEASRDKFEYIKHGRMEGRKKEKYEAKVSDTYSHLNE